jgi:hypothetical protein
MVGARIFRTKKKKTFKRLKFFSFFFPSSFFPRPGGKREKLYQQILPLFFSLDATQLQSVSYQAQPRFTINSSLFTGALAERIHRSKKKKKEGKIQHILFIFALFLFSAFFPAANPIKAVSYGHSEATNKEYRNFSLPELRNMSSLGNMFLVPLSCFHGSFLTTIQFLDHCIPFFQKEHLLEEFPCYRKLHPYIVCVYFLTRYLSSLFFFSPLY